MSGERYRAVWQPGWKEARVVDTRPVAPGRDRELVVEVRQVRGMPIEAPGLASVIASTLNHMQAINEGSGQDNPSTGSGRAGREDGPPAGRAGVRLPGPPPDGGSE